MLTVTVGMPKFNAREPVLPYVARDLDRKILGVQRLCVIWPIEEQGNTGSPTGDGNAMETDSDNGGTVVDDSNADMVTIART